MGTFFHVVLMIGNAALCVSNVISGDYVLTIVARTIHPDPCGS